MAKYIFFKMSQIIKRQKPSSADLKENFIWKIFRIGVFCEFCEIFENTCFTQNSSGRLSQQVHRFYSKCGCGYSMQECGSEAVTREVL